MGAAQAKLFSQEGAKIVIGDMDEVAGNELAHEINKNSGHAIFIRLDVLEEKNWREIVDASLTHFGKIDILVNNAGILRTEGIIETSTDTWNLVIDVNTKGTFLGIKHVIPTLRLNGSGSIINLASMAARVTNRPQMQAHYNSSKAALVQLTKSLAAEWAPLGVRVNTLSPGYTRTEMADAPRTREAQPIWTRDTPMGRMAEVDELQGAAVFLASDASSYVTGHALVVDGGFTVW